MTELLVLIAVLAVAASVQRSREQRTRIDLLGSYLSRYQIERQMATLIEGYMRWLGEEGEERRQQIRGVLVGTEQSLTQQFAGLAKDVQAMPAPQAQVSRLAFWIPFAQQLLPRYRLFDVREAFAIHARGMAAVAANARGLGEKAQARQMMAELLLMQHTCHWYCRSKALADARLVMRHQTAYAQVLATVSPETAQDYAVLTGFSAR